MCPRTCIHLLVCLVSKPPPTHAHLQFDQLATILFGESWREWLPCVLPHAWYAEFACVAPQEEGQQHVHDDSVTSVGIELEGNLDMHRVNKWLSVLLSEQGVDLFRSKGILAIEGSDDK